MLPSHTPDPDTGMNMSREIIAAPGLARRGSAPRGNAPCGNALTHIDIRNVMYKRKRPHRQKLLTQPYPRLLIPTVMQNVVISLYQLYPQIGQVLPPLQKQRQLLILPAMKQIPHYQQPARPEILDLTQQPEQILRVYPLRHRNAFFSKMPRLAKMKITDD